jgi:hypothetical protein
MQQLQGLGIFCDIINDEMDAVKGVEKLPGLASVTAESIKSWSVSGCTELAPTLTQILLSLTAAETGSAKEKNKIKSPVAVCRFVLSIVAHSIIP